MYTTILDIIVTTLTPFNYYPNLPPGSSIRTWKCLGTIIIPAMQKLGELNWLELLSMQNETGLKSWIRAGWLPTEIKIVKLSRGLNQILNLHCIISATYMSQSKTTLHTKYWENVNFLCKRQSSPDGTFSFKLLLQLWSEIEHNVISENKSFRRKKY